MEVSVPGKGGCLWSVGWLVCVLIGFCGCERGSSPGSGAQQASAEQAEVRQVKAAADSRVEKGKDLVSEFQCNRCHVLEEIEPARQEKNCVTCHQAILDGSYDAPQKVLEEWQSHIEHLRHVPSLVDTDARFRRDWVAEFLRRPHSIRPRMGATMPRLEVSNTQARALAAYLVPDSYSTRSLEGGSPERGRKLMADKGCATCHAFSGVERIAAGPLPAGVGDEQLQKGMLLAPDLRYTRQRWRPRALVEWLLEPKSIKSDAVMPDIAMNRREARDIAAYILRADLEAPKSVELPDRLEPLERKVSYKEVEKKVFKKVCWHCHSDPGFNNGDGGPGNTGGFGFEGRGLSLGSYQSIMEGSLDDQGRRHSVFREVAFGESGRQMPLLLAVMYARHAESKGRRVEGIRGMPLGLPPIPKEDIRLLETWMTQGRPR